MTFWQRSSWHLVLELEPLGPDDAHALELHVVRLSRAWAAWLDARGRRLTPWVMVARC